MNNEPLGSYERKIMNYENIGSLFFFLECEIEIAKKEKAKISEKISTWEFASSFHLESIIEWDAKHYAAAFAIDLVDELAQLEGEEGTAGVLKLIRDRILYRITSMTAAPRSTSPSHNAIENARHYELINILGKI